MYKISIQYTNPFKRYRTETIFQSWKIFKVEKGHNSHNNWWILPSIELGLHFMIIYLCIKFQSNTPILSKDIARKPKVLLTGWDGPMYGQRWAISQEVSGSIYSNVNQVIYFSLIIYSLGLKAQASIVFEILCWQGIIQAQASVVFEILCWQDFIHIFSKGHNSGKAHNLDKEKKYVSVIFSWGIHIWNFKTLACTVQQLGYASKCAM